MVVSHILFSQNDVPLDPNDQLLPPNRLDFNAMMHHLFFSSKSSPGDYHYRLLFEAGDTSPHFVHLPAPALFDTSWYG